jgi:hypothetical protein
LLCERADHVRAGGVGEAGELEQVLVEVMLRIRPFERRANEQGAFDGRGEVDGFLRDIWMGWS